MYGDMFGDFSRLTFERANGYSSVVRLQGRVGIEADDNESTAILLHLLRTFTADVIGPFGGPRAGLGFEVEPVTEDQRVVTDLWIGPGRYYVDGILVESGVPSPCSAPAAAPDEEPPKDVPAEDERHAAHAAAEDGREGWTRYYAQPDVFLDRERAQDVLPDQLPFLVYLMVWERLVTAVEAPHVRDVALGATGADSAARTKVVAQVRATPFVPGGQDPIEPGAKDPDKVREEILERWADEGWGTALQGATGARLRARGRSGDPTEDPCTLSPFARYRGFENQLYRVQVHVGGEVGESTPTPTFKWSRDNGSVVFPVESVAGSQAVVQSLGRDDLLSLEVGQWVELVDDERALADVRDELFPPEPLYRVEAIDELERRVTLDRELTGGFDADRHPLLRRWDHGGPQDAFEGGALPIPGPDEWVELEDGVQVQFASGRFRSGEYWVIPARTETGDVEWPGDPDDPPACDPHGPVYHFAPLALVTDDGAIDLRCAFERLACAAAPAREDPKPRPRPRPPSKRPPKKPVEPPKPKPQPRGGGTRPRAPRKPPNA
ncbi:MAG TPA: DUF6519 domain-containing protein [Thermoleophilaceae bacterium]|jgi:hypothetical protein